MLTATSLPITCAHTMVSASGCVGFTLPGMMEEPGSLSGMTSSPMPLRGPLLSMRMSLPIFISDTARRFRAPLSSTMASCAASASNLFGRGNERQAGKLGDLLRHQHAVALGCVESGADRGATERQFAHHHQRVVHRAHAVVELLHVTTELLAQRSAAWHP